MIYEANGVRNWASVLDPQALVQAERTSRLSIVPAPLALMPDAHVGMGATIGSVVPTEGAIIPAAVGVDIGCGMIAARLNIRDSALPDSLERIHDMLYLAIPSGVGKGNLEGSIAADMWMMAHPNETLMTDKRGLATKAATQLGSLGSGNHFLEICVDQDSTVWIVLHSGSRGVGNVMGQQNIKLARSLEQTLEDKDLAYFIEGTSEFKSYITDMLWAQDYAMQNRRIMFERTLAILINQCPKAHVETVEIINCHHNFAEQEVHPINGELKKVWITRKGAIRARVGDKGVIPGSMGSEVMNYIVEGKGVEASYTSCSHGAGRRMSRSQAKRELTTESLRESMAGVTWNKDASGLLDEHQDSYKDIDIVMRDQEDLVNVTHILKKVLNYKGQ